MKFKKIFYSVIIVIPLFYIFIGNNTNIVRATVINPTQTDANNANKDMKKKLGKKIYNMYTKKVKDLNRKVAFHYLGTSSHKIYFPYYNKYPSIRKFFGDINHLNIFNRVTTNDDINNAPWIMNGNAPYLWNLQNGRNIYYHINATGNIADIYNAAIGAWNQLGVVQLVPTDNTGSYVIQLNNPADLNTDTNNNSKIVTEGITYHSYTSGESEPSNVSITLNNDINNADYYRQLIVAEHEIGHALGFAHDDRTKYDDDTNKTVISIMNSVTDTPGDNYANDILDQNLIGAKEQHVLMQRYNLSVLPGYYEYPVVSDDSSN